VFIVEYYAQHGSLLFVCGYFQKRIRLMIGVLILTLFVDNASDAKISFDRVAWHLSGHSCWNL
jgi:hypothetical protein